MKKYINEQGEEFVDAASFEELKVQLGIAIKANTINFRNGHALQKRIAELEKKFDITKEALMDFVLEAEHMPGCEMISFGEDYDCKCMDRSFYNKSAVMARARQILVEAEK